MNCFADFEKKGILGCDGLTAGYILYFLQILVYILVNKTVQLIFNTCIQWVKNILYIFAAMFMFSLPILWTDKENGLKYNKNKVRIIKNEWNIL